MKSKHYMAGLLAFLLFLMPMTAFAGDFDGGGHSNDVIGPSAGYDDGASTSIGQGSVFTGPVTGTFGSGGSSSGSSSSNSGSSKSGGGGSTTPPSGQGYFTQPSDEEIAGSIADLIARDVIDDPYLGGGYKVFDPNGNETNTDWTSYSYDSGLTKRGYEALYWDWKFANKNTGTVVPREKMPPNGQFKQIFSEAGHWYAYYREYGKWEEGYYTTRTVEGTTVINGKEYNWKRKIREWNHVAWKEGYKFNYRLLVDFFITTDMIGKPVDVPPQQRQIPVETKQTVAK